MKKIILSFVIVLFVIIAQSCDGMISTEKEQKAIAEKILECLDEENTDELKSLFCEKILTEKEDLDRQIERAMVFFEGKTESYDTNRSISDSDGRYYEGGKIVEISTSGSIRDVITDQDKYYRIKFYNYLVLDEDPTREGISEITIYSEEGYSRVIGDFYLVNPEYR